MKLALELLNNEYNRVKRDMYNMGDATGIYKLKLYEITTSILELNNLK